MTKQPKMPDTIKIDVIHYEVKQTEPLLSNGAVIAGRIDTKKGVIEIASDACLDQQKITLMHEIMHGILIHRNFEKTALTTEQYETFCDEMAKGLIQIIRDNPELIDFIKK